MDSNGDLLNGTLFLGIPGSRNSARAITVFGMTALMRAWRWDGGAGSSRRGTRHEHDTAAVHAARRGFSLIETVIAMGILATGLLSLAGVFVLGLRNLAGSSANLIAREKAREAVESVHTARDTRVITWAQIRNVAHGGVFLDGAQPLRTARPGRSGQHGRRHRRSRQSARARPRQHARDCGRRPDAADHVTRARSRSPNC